MNDYERIASVIRYLDRHHAEQPELATLAGHVGLSVSRFHRLFSHWAGITPKDFLQCLTLAHARQLLAEGKSVLDAALQAGLSGPGRLHDLCVNLEAASPGELKAGGPTFPITAGFGSSPFGNCLLATSPRGICHLAFVDSGNERTAWSELEMAWPNAELHRNDRAIEPWTRQIFARAARAPDDLPLRAFVKGTAFQVRVWRALLQIPSGCLLSYGALAAEMGQPKAVRAVGTAVGRNPIAYLIPCHRVIRDTGVLGQYRWGALRKRMLVAWETDGR